ncbi:unnamed protein product [Ceratitis capitata]|uniref:(Mediterranean fruit fly) hypothetical protein n=1 Tax=Ceratitis capitata TaxID=7213 RepID=A0A811V191_CERCA|nr:unnamed protein product [Ceratitis capitata]
MAISIFSDKKIVPQLPSAKWYRKQVSFGFKAIGTTSDGNQCLRQPADRGSVDLYAREFFYARHVAGYAPPLPRSSAPTVHGYELRELENSKPVQTAK